MWYLFKDYVDTPNHIEFLIFGVSIIASYIVAFVSCKSRNMSGYEVRVIATAAGLMVAVLVGGVKFTFVSTLAGIDAFHMADGEKRAFIGLGMNHCLQRK